jgi:hypothetical protein
MRNASRRTAARRVTLRHQQSLIDAWRGLMKDVFDPYRPELHYMRGPGPKWQEKHQRVYAPAPVSGEFARVTV